MRLTRHALIRARQRGIPIVVVEEVYEDPDYRAPSHRNPDRELRGRQYDDRLVEIVVDLVDGSVISVWKTQVAG
jgi:hypothetical protein